MKALPQDPLISVVIPSFNQGKYIREVLESILGQSYSNVEVVIADGASTDDTLDILKSYAEEPRVKWVSEPDEGPARAVEKAISLASGDLLNFQTTSDPYLPGVLAEVVREFRSDATLAFVGGSMNVTDEFGEETGETWETFAEPHTYSIDEVLQFKNLPGMPASFLRLDLVRKIGGYSTMRPNACHTSFFLHYLLESYSSGLVAKTVPSYWASFRQHPNPHNAREDLKGKFLAIERHKAVEENIVRYSEFLSGRQKRLMRRHAYYFELWRQANHHRDGMASLRCLMGAFRNGARPSELAGLAKRFGSVFYYHFFKKAQPSIEI